jgi:hypothetical protein
MRGDERGTNELSERLHSQCDVAMRQSQDRHQVMHACGMAFVRFAYVLVMRTVAFRG